MNRERIQEKKKDKITWQVIIHSTFFFFDCSFLFHFLDDYFQLIQIEISFWYSSCSLFDDIFSKMYLKRKEGKARNSRSRKKWWNFQICRNDETQWNDWRRKTNSKEKERNEIVEIKENKSQMENITWQVIWITPPFCDCFLCFIWFHTCQIISFWVFLSCLFFIFHFHHKNSSQQNVLFE